MVYIVNSRLKIHVMCLRNRARSYKCALIYTTLCMRKGSTYNTIAIHYISSHSKMSVALQVPIQLIRRLANSCRVYIKVALELGNYIYMTSRRCVGECDT